MSGPHSETRLNLSAGIFSVTVALVLVGAKLWALSQTGALSIAATLADSALDLIMSGASLWAITYAARPPDEDHAFGHTSAEDLTALAQSVFILISAALIAWLASGRLWSDTPPALAAEGQGLFVVGLSIVLTLGLVWWQRRVVQQTGSKVVAADSLHYLGDLIPNIGAMLALSASWVWGIFWVDAVVALLAAGLMTVGAWRIGQAAWDALMDRRADPAVIAGIAALARAYPGVLGYHDLKTRSAGSRIFVNLHIELDGDQSLTEAHAIGAGLRHAIMTSYPRVDILIHKDPWRPGR
jgi:ferrous-iron efflux pump FieF